jgi:DNA-binding XRE family transcriptional regulator
MSPPRKPLPRWIRPMLGTELPEWRSRNRFTQDTLRMALGVKSRQTIITWEKSTEPLPRLIELALMTLERFPEERKVTTLATVHRITIPASF